MYAEDRGERRRCRGARSPCARAGGAAYAKNCLIGGMAVGAEDGCEDVNDTTKREWDGDEAKAYDKDSVM